MPSNLFNKAPHPHPPCIQYPQEKRRPSQRERERERALKWYKHVNIRKTNKENGKQNQREWEGFKWEMSQTPFKYTNRYRPGSFINGH